MNICIIGAGASGLMAAISAASNSDAKITVFERNDAVCKKLRITGNGKCNITNTEFNTGFYYSDAPDILERVFSGFGPEDTLSFFSEKGLLLKCMNGSGVYPVSEQAGSVAALLKAEAKRLGINIVNGIIAEGIHKCGRGYVLDLKPSLKDVEPGTLADTVYDRVILACGTGAGITGREKDLLNTEKLIKCLGVSATDFEGVLNGLLCSGPEFSELKGVRSKGRVYISFDGSFAEYLSDLDEAEFGPDVGIIKDKEGLKLFSDGEIQFTESGISGICVFQLSRFVARYIKSIKGSNLERHEKRKKESFKNENRLPDISLRGSIDLLNEKILYNCAYKDPESIFLKRKTELKDETLLSFLSIYTNKKIASSILKKAKLPSGRELAYIRDSEILNVYRLLRAFPFTVTGLRDKESAQVWSGGISLGALNENLEVKAMPGVFACGEMVNADGPCGGYNLQWAWSSGYMAGINAAKA